MQVFMPFENPYHSLNCLDTRRLGKQRVEASQIIKIIESQSTGAWSNHPATNMYRGYLEWLKAYYNLSLLLFESRGGNNIKLCSIPVDTANLIIPPFIGNHAFHLSHQSNLLRKAIDDSNGIGRNGYKRPSTELLERLAMYKITEETVPLNLEYVW